MKRLDGMQGLRAIAFLAIFLAHSGLGPFEAFGVWGVSVFLVLSGFLMIYNYLPRSTYPEFGVRFAWQKIKRLYPLHIATTLGALLYVIVSGQAISIFETASDLSLHVALVQTWAPYSRQCMTLNGISWYLSVCLFLYFCFPLILKYFARRKIEICGGGGNIWINRILCASCRSFRFRGGLG